MKKRRLVLPVLALSLSLSPMILPTGMQSRAMAATAYDILVQNSPATIQQIEAVDSSLAGTNKIENFVNDFSSLIQSSGPVTDANLHDKFYSAAIQMMVSSNADDKQVANDVIQAFHIDPTSSTFPPDLLPLKDAIKTQLLGGSTSTSTTATGGGGVATTTTTSSDDSAVLDAAIKNAVDQHVKLTIDAAQKSFAFSLTQLDSMKKSGQSLDLAIQGIQFEIPAQNVDLTQAGAADSSQLQIAVNKVTTDDSLKAAAKYPLVGDVYEFSASAIQKDGTKKDIEPFSGDIGVNLPIPQDYKGELGNLKVFRYNDATKAWDLLGGTYDSTSGMVKFATNHFSKYALMEVKADSSLPFTDINGHWAQQDIMTLYAKGIVKGSNGKAFPDANVTRAEFASFLVQLLDLPKSTKTLTFHDADASAWYYSNLASAYDAGLMSGYNKDQIGPNDLISREQMATMMANALKYKGIMISNTAAVHFKDQGLIHGWALNGVTVASEVGIAKGLKDGTFNPRGFATRAEAMTMMARLLEKL